MHGKNRIGYTLSARGSEKIQAIDPATGQSLSGDFYVATEVEINDTMRKAQSAFELYSKFSGEKKATFLEAIADEIMSLDTQLVQRTMAETALPEARIIGERGRTVNQLRLFATLLRDGSWVDASIDTAMPDREPLPKPDIRKMSTPVGPVVVFAASNFPLAFSTAGGDTASALAAGNPVIMKAHGSHLGTNELVADAISRAAEKTGMPDGVFSSLQGSGFLIGQQLVKHSITKSVAFTGSYSGGKALYDTAAQRDEPIPVFAEMGSINPVVVLPEKLKKDSQELAKEYATSITLGVGQFCTNPGLLIGLESDELTQFISLLGSEVESIKPAVMLNEGISQSYHKSKESVLKLEGVEVIAETELEDLLNGGNPTIATVRARDFINRSALQNEVFGPYSLVVQCVDRIELDQVIEHLHGQLTATVMGTDKDVDDFTESIQLLSKKAGRLIFNGVPTGVEVCYSMQHGGPFPASTDARFTSVGTEAIKRFVRPLAFQNAPQSFLPDELKDSNPMGIWRKVNGEMSNKPI